MNGLPGTGAAVVGQDDGAPLSQAELQEKIKNAPVLGGGGLGWLKWVGWSVFIGIVMWGIVTLFSSGDEPKKAVAPATPTYATAAQLAALQTQVASLNNKLSETGMAVVQAGSNAAQALANIQALNAVVYLTDKKGQIVFDKITKLPIIRAEVAKNTAIKALGESAAAKKAADDAMSEADGARSTANQARQEAAAAQAAADKAIAAAKAAQASANKIIKDIKSGHLQVTVTIPGFFKDSQNVVEVRTDDNFGIPPEEKKKQ